MPYIGKDRRIDMEPILEAMVVDDVVTPASPGELNYLITSICTEYLGDAPDYTDFNEVIGVLACATQELYRRLVAPYEDIKKAQNGDVY